MSLRKGLAVQGAGLHKVHPLKSRESFKCETVPYLVKYKNPELPHLQGSGQMNSCTFTGQG